MTQLESRSNWLSEIFDEMRHASERPIPLLERKAERDAIVTAIKSHPQGQKLAATTDLADLVWAALGVAHNREQDQKQNPHLEMPSPAIQASLFLFNVNRLDGN
jgi:hypothetical protein